MRLWKKKLRSLFNLFKRIEYDTLKINVATNALIKYSIAYISEYFI